MYSSETFGRLFWVDDDYVSERTDWDGVDMNLLLAIHRCELINKVQYAGSLTHKETPKITNKNESNMNTYDEQFYKEIVKDSEFRYGKFNENNYPLHLTQH